MITDTCIRFRFAADDPQPVAFRRGALVRVGPAGDPADRVPLDDYLVMDDPDPSGVVYLAPRTCGGSFKVDPPHLARVDELTLLSPPPAADMPETTEPPPPDARQVFDDLTEKAAAFLAAYRAAKRARTPGPARHPAA